MVKQRELKKICTWSIPAGSTSLASLIASEVAISWLAGDIANMIELGYKKT
jgi:hypothetical protein